MVVETLKKALLSISAELFLCPKGSVHAHAHPHRYHGREMWLRVRKGVSHVAQG